MDNVILQKTFYNRDTLKVAQALLGCHLVRKIRRKIIRARIVETEAYVGENDLACHASKGRTKRTETMYGEAGHAYVYMIYGMYHCLNIVTEKKNFPAAVLIRAVEVMSSSVIPVSELESKKNKSWISGQARDDKKTKTDGPGKLCRFLEIDRTFNGWDMTRGEKLWIDRPVSRLRNSEVIMTSKRIGIDYAKHCKEYLWRFGLTPGVSSRRTGRAHPGAEDTSKVSGRI